MPDLVNDRRCFNRPVGWAAAPALLFASAAAADVNAEVDLRTATHTDDDAELDVAILKQLRSTWDHFAEGDSNNGTMSADALAASITGRTPDRVRERLVRLRDAGKVVESTVRPDRWMIVIC